MLIREITAIYDDYWGSTWAAGALNIYLVQYANNYNSSSNYYFSTFTYRPTSKHAHVFKAAGCLVVCRVTVAKPTWNCHVDPLKIIMVSNIKCWIMYGI